MARRCKAAPGGTISMEELSRRVEERIETGRRSPRRLGAPKLPDELEVEFARSAEEAAASWAAWERSEVDNMLRCLRRDGYGEMADTFAAKLKQLRVYERAVDVRNARADLTRINRGKNLKVLNANRQPSQTAIGVEEAYRRHRRMGKSVEDARRLVHHNYGGDYSKRHINRMLAAAQADADKRKTPGRE